MAKIEAMIDQANSWRKEHNAHKRRVEACLAAVRCHALIDAYEALGGDGLKWRNRVGKLP